MTGLPLPITSVATPPAGLRKSHPWIGLALWLALVGLVAALGAGFGPDAWYAALVKPAWTPPPGVFAPAWTALYLMMAIAAWQVWRAPGPVPQRRRALRLMGVQLALNAAWSPLFFGAHAPGLAFLDIAALCFVVALTIMAFARVRASAATLMLPYLAWIAFAAALNAAIWLAN